MKKIKSIILCMVLLCSLIYPCQNTLYVNAASDSAPVMRFFNVGAGDCELIEYTYNGTQHWILVDSGQANSTSHVTAFMNEYNITYFDYVIITHYHSDHIGGLATILGVDLSDPNSTPKIGVGTFLARKYATATAENLKAISDPAQYGDFYQQNFYNNFVKFQDIRSHYQNNADSRFNAEWYFPNDNSNTTFTIGNMTLRFLNKNTTFITSTNLAKFNKLTTDSEKKACPYKPHSLVNNDSLVFRLEYKGINGLFTGDIHQLASEYLLSNHKSSLSAKYLKVQHHALIDINNTKTSYLKTFFKAVMPSTSVICSKPVSECSTANQTYINNIKSYLKNTIKSSVFITGDYNSRKAITME